MGDELFDVRNSLIVGNFHQAIAEGSNAKTVLKKPDDVAAFNVDRDALVARAQIGLGQYDAVISEMRTATHSTLVAVRQFAEFSRDAAGGSDASEILNKLVESSTEVQGSRADVAILAVAALIQQRDLSGALRLANKWTAGIDSQAFMRQAIELRALTADALLRLQRAELAEKEVQQMKSLDDESTLTILTAGLVALRQGPSKRSKFDEAAQCFQEVTSRCGSSVLTMNLLAIANVGRGKVTEAEKNVLDALSKKSGDADTTANMVMVAAQAGKPLEQVQRLINQARNVPGSAWGKSFSSMEERFKEAAAGMV
jgi:coatomer subunit epsilon